MSLLRQRFAPTVTLYCDASTHPTTAALGGIAVVRDDGKVEHQEQLAMTKVSALEFGAINAALEIAYGLVTRGECQRVVVMSDAKYVVERVRVRASMRERVEVRYVSRYRNAAHRAARAAARGREVAA